MPALIILFATYLQAFLRAFKDPSFRILSILMVILILGGAYFFHQIEGWSYLDAVYFCVVTLATVGYGDLTPTTNTGKIFTIFYIPLGIGTFVAFATTLAQNLMKKDKRTG